MLLLTFLNFERCLLSKQVCEIIVFYKGNIIYRCSDISHFRSNRTQCFRTKLLLPQRMGQVTHSMQNKCVLLYRTVCLL